MTTMPCTAGCSSILNRAPIVFSPADHDRGFS